MTIFNIIVPDNVVPWSTIISHCDHSNSNTLSMIYRLKVLPDHQEFEYEYSGPPLAIMDNIRVLSNNVCFVSEIKEKEVLALLFPYSKLFQGLTSFETALRIVKILTRLEHYFEPEQKDKLLKYHNGYDYIISYDGKTTTDSSQFQRLGEQPAVAVAKLRA